MRLLPHERLSMRASLTPDEVSARLGELVAPGFWHLRPPPRPFMGTVRGRWFKIARVLLPTGARRRNTSPPVIVGNIAPGPYGSEIRARIRLGGPSILFYAIWLAVGLGVPLGIAISALRAVLTQPSPEPGAWGLAAGAGLFAAIMLVAAWASIMMPFGREVREARKLLTERLGCREIEANRLVRSA